MRYLLKQKLFSFGDDFTIKDDDGNAVYQVDGKAFTLLREKLSFEDLQGQELAFIRERLIALTPSYEILRDGEVAAVVKKDLINLFRCGFTVDVPGPDDLEAQGNLLDHEYTFTRGQREVAIVSEALVRAHRHLRGGDRPGRGPGAHPRQHRHHRHDLPRGRVEEAQAQAAAAELDLSPSPPRGRGSGRGLASYFAQPCERSRSPHWPLDSARGERSFE